MLYGYARVSTTDQSLAVQTAALTAAGCTIVRGEQVSGASRNGRPELRTLLEFIRAGDILVVTRLDRLARSAADLHQIVKELAAKGADLRCIEQAIDTSSPSGKALLGMLGVFAEFERDIIRERQAEGIKAAKARGVYKGRPASIDAANVIKLASDGLSPAQIARRLGISRASVFRLRKAAAP